MYRNAETIENTTVGLLKKCPAGFIKKRNREDIFYEGKFTDVNKLDFRELYQ